jgi:ABC-type nitrate/sulfonate/bicarbonate transport system substrate-binding protein
MQSIWHLGPILGREADGSMKHRRPILVAALALLVAALAGCGGAPQTSGQPGGQPAAQSGGGGGSSGGGTPFVIGSPVGIPNLVHIVPYVALDKGYFREAGLDVKIIQFQGGIQALKAGMTGRVNLTWTDLNTLDPAYMAGAKDLRAYYSTAPKLDGAIVAVGSVKAIQDLPNAKVGMTGEVGGYADMMYRLAFQKYGVDYNKVHMIPTTTEGRVQSLVTGQTQTGVFHVDQVNLAQKARPDVHVIARMWEVAPDWQYSVMVADSKDVQAHRQTYEKAIEAMIRAARFVYTNRDETLQIAAKYTKEDPQALADAYDQLAKAHVWAVNAGLDPARYDYTVHLTQQVGLLQGQPPSFDQVVDLSLVREALQNLGPFNGDAQLGD